MRDIELYTLHAAGLSYREIAERTGLTRDGVRGRVGRVRRQLSAQPFRAARQDVPLALTGDWLVAGDVHLPSIRADLFDKFLAIAKRWLPPGRRRCILAGDLVNAEAFSPFEPAQTPSPFAQELSAARDFFTTLLSVFDQVIVLPGNHDRRLSKRTRGALSFGDLLRLIVHTPRVIVTDYGFVTIQTPQGVWRVTHGSQFSQTPLTQAERLAWKYQQHVISHHEHRLAVGHDRYGHYILVNNGGLFDHTQLAYVHRDDSGRPTMVPGFTLLRHGFPYVFGLWTDWTLWLSRRRGHA